MKILFIPHVPNVRVVNRVYEFAKHSDNYVLHWRMQNHSLGAKIYSQCASLCVWSGAEGKTLRMPMLFRPQAAATRWNTYMLNRLLKRYRIDAVVNANALLFDVAAIKVPVVYDLVDDHLDTNASVGLDASRVEKIKRDIAASRGVVCVTSALERKAAALHARTCTVENGVPLERFATAVSKKRELGWEHKKVFGYIGGVAPWTGLEKACEAYMRIRSDATAMAVVGGDESAYFKRLKKRFGDAILFVGPVPPEKVADWFKTLDVGLIPFELNDFTHHAMPIKALEYGLAGAQVLATPLRALEAKMLPFVHTVPIEAFAEAMDRIKPETVTFDFASYSWQHRTQQLLDFVWECLDG